jgi:hypothetical protein
MQRGRNAWPNSFILSMPSSGIIIRVSGVQIPPPLTKVSVVNRRRRKGMQATPASEEISVHARPIRATNKLTLARPNCSKGCISVALASRDRATTSRVIERCVCVRRMSPLRPSGTTRQPCRGIGHRLRAFDAANAFPRRAGTESSSSAGRRSARPPHLPHTVRRPNDGTSVSAG